MFTVIVISSAQKTGAWSENLAFSTTAYLNQTRTLAFYAPTNYNSLKKYKLLVLLHGQGDTPANFVSYMANLLTTFFPNYNLILVAPSEGAAGTGFVDPPGEDDGICDLAVSEAKRLYNIDPKYVWLCGFSWGGRAALHIGLQDYQKYRGLMLWTPAVPSNANADNTPGADIDPYTNMEDGITYAYPNGKIIPSCMTVGDNDPFGFTTVDEEVNNQMKANGAKCYFTVLGTESSYWGGQGEHNVPVYDSDYVSCFNFITANTTTSINELMESNLGMIVYPNPATNEATISLAIPKEEYEKITTVLVNVLGQQVKMITNEYRNGDLYINLDDVPGGIYILKVTTQSLSYERKLVIEK